MRNVNYFLNFRIRFIYIQRRSFYKMDNKKKVWKNKSKKKVVEGLETEQ